MLLVFGARLHSCFRLLRYALFDTGLMQFGCCTRFRAGSTVGRSFPQLQLRSPPWLRSLSLWLFVPSLSLS